MAGTPFCSASAELVQAFAPKPEPDGVEAAKAPASRAPSHLLSNLTLDFISPQLTAIGSISPTDLPRSQDSVQLENTCIRAGLCPAHGVKAVCGKRAKMEDHFVVQLNFFDLPTVVGLVEELPTPLATHPSNDTSLLSSPNLIEQLGGIGLPSPLPPARAPTNFTSAQPDASLDACHDRLHFFGVYDGHGGSEAAQHCAARLHQHLSNALTDVSNQLQTDAAGSAGAGMEGVPNGTPCISSSSSSNAVGEGEASSAPALGSALVNIAPSAQASISCPSSLRISPAAAEERLPVGSALSACYDSLDPPSTSSSPSSSSSSDPSFNNVPNASSLLEDALRTAFLNTDNEFAADCLVASNVGSTAVVALLGKACMWLAHCGDSRAVLCRGGRAIQLTDDHKPEREDEAERVEKAGGQVLFWNGHRVMGVLAMSRAIGDHGLRPYVIADPEISVMQRDVDDEFLLLASDGLWDVMTNQEATQLAKRCMLRARDKGASCRAAVRVAASVLTSAAIDRGSKDNVTVLIVDLKASVQGAAVQPMAVQPVAEHPTAGQSMAVPPTTVHPKAEHPKAGVPGGLMVVPELTGSGKLGTCASGELGTSGSGKLGSNLGALPVA